MQARLDGDKDFSYQESLDVDGAKKIIAKNQAAPECKPGLKTSTFEKQIKLKRAWALTFNKGNLHRWNTKQQESKYGSTYCSPPPGLSIKHTKHQVCS